MVYLDLIQQTYGNHYIRKGIVAQNVQVRCNLMTDKNLVSSIKKDGD